MPRRDYKLLYRGSRDSMTAAAFHALCDDQRPTLVLIRCNKGWVFGGYAGTSWNSRSFSAVASPDAFLLSVVGPHTPGPVKFPVVNPHKALYCHGIVGPSFFQSLYVFTSDSTASFCSIGDGTGYADVLGQGDNSLTGGRLFTPTEVEVFAVTHTKAPSSH